jgi:hypothetical protein
MYIVMLQMYYGKYKNLSMLLIVTVWLQLFIFVKGSLGHIKKLNV